jgi:spheroidene monooxygenase
MPVLLPASAAVSGVVAVVLLDYLKAHQAWGWMRLVQGPSALKDLPGLSFAKVMGSGQGGGFSLRPSATHQGLIGVFDDAEQAELFLNGPLVQACRDKSRHHWTGMLAVTSARGQWDGRSWSETAANSLGTYAESQAALVNAPMAALTRASIRPAKAVAFWRHAPAAQSDLQHAPGCALAMGLGEAPLVRQCTFSLWRDTQSMLDYAHSGAHQHAIQAAYKSNYFSESMFVRMRVLQSQGNWPGMQSHASAA